jgi:hypothetical protein
MTRTQTIWLPGLTVLALLALSGLPGCSKTTPPEETSSGSNWLACETLGDCGDGRAVRCSDDGYCLDEDDERIPVDGTDPSTEPRAGSGASGAAGELRPDPVTALDASLALDGGQGATVPENDAARPVMAGTLGFVCDLPGSRDPLIPRNDETCYTFAVHGVSSETDTTPFAIANGESYNQFYYAVPWPAGTVATRYGVVDDSGHSVHAWLFSVAPGHAPGTVSANVTGTLLGENARMLAAWSRGGCNVTLPDDAGLVLPDGGDLVVQWHHENATSSAVDDSSELRICTVPAANRPNLAGITILGTENFNGAVGAPPGTSQFGTTCVNDSGDDVRILSITPHMHRIGAGVTVVIERAAGDSELAFDQPFQFGDAQHYVFDPTVVMFPGDVIRSTCRFDNTTGQNVQFGQSAQQENCFLFAIAYPTPALDNGAISLLGATNTCW